MSLQLREISSFDLGNLISRWNGSAPNEVFHILKFSAIRDSNKLKNLLTSDVAHCLLQLEFLGVERFSGMDRVMEPSEINEVASYSKIEVHSSANSSTAQGALQ